MSLDGGKGETEGFGDFAEGQTAVMAQEKDGSLAVWELRERGVEPTGEVARIGGGRHRRLRGDGLAERLARTVARAQAASTDEVEGGRRGRFLQPRFRLVRTRPDPPTSPQAEECLLRGVGSEMIVSQNGTADAEHEILVFRDEPVEFEGAVHGRWVHSTTETTSMMMSPVTSPAPAKRHLAMFSDSISAKLPLMMVPGIMMRKSNVSSLRS